MLSFVTHQVVKKASQAAAIAAFQAMGVSAKALAKKRVDSIVQKRTDATTLVHPPADPISYSAGEIDDLAHQYQQDLATRKTQAAQSAQSGAYSSGPMLANVLQTSQTMGFTSAGAWYSTIAGISSQMETALSGEVNLVSSDDPNTVVAGSVRAEADSDIILIDDANNGASSATTLGSPSSAAPKDSNKMIGELTASWCPTSGLANANNSNALVSTLVGQCIIEGITSSNSLGANSSVLVRVYFHHSGCQMLIGSA